MFGFTSSGCFILGIIFGFILAAIIGVACVFYFNSDFKSKSISQVEHFWQKIKDSVDDSIDTVKKAPTASPAGETKQPQVKEPAVSTGNEKDDIRKNRKSEDNKNSGIVIKIGQNRINTTEKWIII